MNSDANKRIFAGHKSLLFRRLSYAKYLLGVARASLGSPVRTAAALGLLQLHDSIEIFQVAVLDAIGVNVKSNRPFMEFWELVKDKTGNEPPYKGVFEALNKTRVSLKHFAILPDVQELRGLCAVVPSFYSEVTANLLHLDFATISLADLLEQPEVREHMSKAELALASEEFKTAIAEAAIAFTVLFEERDTVPPQYEMYGLDLFDRTRLWDQLPVDVSSDVTKLCTAVGAQIEEVQRVIEMLAWGIDLEKYKKFRYLTPHVLRASSGVVELLFERTLAIHINRDNADFCYQFVLESGLSLQEQTIRVLNARSPHRLRTSQNPAHLYQCEADNSLRVLAEIPGDYLLEGTACFAPTLGDAWQVTYKGIRGMIRYSDAVLLEGDEP